MKNRLTKKTPKFFRVLRNIGIALVAAGTAIATAPVSLPAGLVAAAGYIITAGSVAAAVSQAVTTEESDETENEK